MEREMETGIMQRFLGIRAYRNSGSVSGSPKECILGVLIWGPPPFALSHKPHVRLPFCSSGFGASWFVVSPLHEL